MALAKAFVGGKVQPLDRSINSNRLYAILAPTFRVHPPYNPDISFRQRTLHSSSSFSSRLMTSRHAQPASRTLVFAVSSACFLWTLLLLLLTIAPNYIVNWVMKTASFDGGSFWLLVDPAPSMLALGILGLWIVAIGFLSLLMRIVKSERPRKDGDRCPQLSLQLYHESSARDKSIWYRRAATAIQMAKETLEDGGNIGYIAKVGLRLGDFLTDFALLYMNLEAGMPICLIVVFTIITVSSALSSAVFLSLPSAKTSQLAETLLDTLFDFLVAIAYPCLALSYCLSTFSFDYEMFEINLDIFPPGVFETAARLVADPVQTAIIQKILASLRIVSVLDFFARVGVNVFLCARMHYIVGLLHKSELQKRRRNLNTRAKYRCMAGALFTCLAGLVVVFVEESIRTSALACQPHSECRVNAWRWTSVRPDSLTQCPCLTLIDGDKAPKTYAEWIQPKNLTDKVAQLATTGDLQTIQLTNRYLPALPLELRRCKQIKHVSLVYTHISSLPAWFKDFTNLEYLHIEGSTESSLVSLPDDLFEKMSSLTFIHLAVHPALHALPSFHGLTGLRSLTLALLLSLVELPSLDYLHSLEKLQLSGLVGLDRLPDLTPVSSTLKSFIVGDRGAWCCNGFLGACNLPNPLCGVHPVYGTPAASCLAGDTATPGTKALLSKFSRYVCGPVLQPGTQESSPTVTGMDQCNGTLYRECYQPGYAEAMCYSARFMGIACTPNPYSIAVRRRQIKEDVGTPCDPKNEAWLGCT